MSNTEHLIEQHIREYESRLRHIDELYERAHAAAADTDSASGAEDKLRDIDAQRSLLRETADELRTMPLERWREDTIQNAGPMAIWDVLAQKLEDFIERHE